MSYVTRKASSFLPTLFGTFEIIVYSSEFNDFENVVLKKEWNGEIPLVRLHSKCLTGDSFSSLRCECGDQLHKAMERIGKMGGVILYLNQEGRGIGLTNKINAYALQDQGIDTVEANLHLGLPIDARDYQAAADMLKDLGISKIRLLTNNPEKVRELEKSGIKIEEILPIEIAPNKYDRKYLETKKAKLGHKLKLV